MGTATTRSSSLGAAGGGAAGGGATSSAGLDAAFAGAASTAAGGGALASGRTAIGRAPAHPVAAITTSDVARSARSEAKERMRAAVYSVAPDHLASRTPAAEIPRRCAFEREGRTARSEAVIGERRSGKKGRSMAHGINGKHRSEHQDGLRARSGWLALGLISLVASCSSETTATSTSGAATTGGAGAGSASSGGSAAQCAIGVQDVMVSEGAGSSPSVAFADDHYLVAWTSTAKDAGDIRVALFDAKGTKVTEQALAETLGESSFSSVIPRPAAVSRRLARQGDPRLDGEGPPRRRAGHAQGRGLPDRPERQRRGAPEPRSGHGGRGDRLGRHDGLDHREPHGRGDLGKVADHAGHQPVVRRRGTNLAITWTAGSQVGASKVASPGGPLSPVLFRTAPGKANAPRVAVHDDGSLAVVWEDNRDGDGNETIYMTRIDKSGTAGAEKLIPMSTESANYPDVAWTGSHDAVVYYQFRDGPRPSTSRSSSPTSRRTAKTSRSRATASPPATRGSPAPATRWALWASFTRRKTATSASRSSPVPENRTLSEKTRDEKRVGGELSLLPSPLLPI